MEKSVSTLGFTPTTSKGENKISLTVIIENQVGYVGWFNPDDTLEVVSNIALELTHIEKEALNEWNLTNRFGVSLDYSSKLRGMSLDRETIFLSLKEVEKNGKRIR